MEAINFNWRWMCPMTFCFIYLDSPYLSSLLQVWCHHHYYEQNLSLDWQQITFAKSSPGVGMFCRSGIWSRLPAVRFCLQAEEEFQVFLMSVSLVQRWRRCACFQLVLLLKKLSSGCAESKGWTLKCDQAKLGGHRNQVLATACTKWSLALMGLL